VRLCGFHKKGNLVLAALVLSFPTCDADTAGVGGNSKIAHVERSPNDGAPKDSIAGRWCMRENVVKKVEESHQLASSCGTNTLRGQVDVPHRQPGLLLRSGVQHPQHLPL